MNLFKLLNANNYISFNRPLAHAIGLNATIFLSELLDKYEHFKSEDKLIEFKDLDGFWFYLMVETAQERTTLGEKEQRHAVEILTNLGFITKVVKGAPGKRYFQIHEKVIENYFTDSNNVYITSQKPIRNLPKANSKPPKSQFLYKDKEPKEEPKIKTSSSSLKPPPNSEPKKAETLKEEMMREISCTEEEYKEAWCSYEKAKNSYEIPYPRGWLKTVILSNRQLRQEVENMARQSEEEQEKMIKDAIERIKSGFYDRN
jgi:hypothetical protein